VTVHSSDDTDARLQLSVHQLDAATGTCVDCREPAPCPAANEAAEILCRQGTLLVEPEARSPRGDRAMWFRRVLPGMS
jgi:hypothetical protein